MRRRALVAAVLLAVTAIPIGVTGIAGPTLSVRAADPRTSVAGGLCSLWTERQVSRAMKEAMKVVRNEPDRCVWYGKADRSGRLDRDRRPLVGRSSSAASFLEQARASGPTWDSEGVVAGIPVIRTEMTRFARAREIQVDAFPDADTWLQFSARSERGANVRSAIERLIEVAVPALISSAAASPSPATSPDASPVVSACALLTTGEVAAALGTPAAAVVTDEPQSCAWSAGQTGGTDSTLILTRVIGVPDSGTNLERARLEQPDSVEIDIAGVPALQAPAGPSASGVVRGTLHVFPDPATSLVLEASAPAGVDIASSLSGLAALTLPRLVPSPTPSIGTTSPAPSSSAAADLPALFPATVGDSPITVQTLPLAGEGGFLSAQQVKANQRLGRLLQEQGSDIKDVRVGIGQTASGSAAILAIHAPGADIEPLVPSLLRILAMDREEGNVPAAAVAGKSAFSVSQGGGEPGYGYPKGDILWIVFGSGPDVLEILQGLP